MSLTPSTRSNPCPICEDASGKCRQSREDLNYWQCMTSADTKKFETINGYKCLGNTKCGQWAQFKPDNSQEWTDQQRLDWKRQNQARAAAKAKVDEQPRLSAVERHEQYTKIFSELSLSTEDKADLIRRGFTASQIKLSGIKSVEKYQALQGQYSELLPGVYASCKSLIVSQSGYLIPIRNVDGLIVACQIRVRALPVGEKNRYRWLSSEKASAHVTTGFNLKAELPLAVHRPGGKPSGIALVEGTGAKPFLTSQRLNALVLGAAGGQFAASESTFKMYLDRLSNELEGTKELVIYPDAGDVRNPQVMQRWQSVIELLHKWGWATQFGWWGQVDTSQLDIDELSNLNQVEYISTNEFFALAESSKVVANTTLNTIGNEHPKSEWWMKRNHAEWLSRKKFTATHKINPENGYFDWQQVDENTCLFIKSGLGTGKTTWLRKLIESIKDGRWISLGYRNTLLIQFCAERLGQAKTGMIHIHDKDGETLLKDIYTNIALCADSILKFQPEDFDGCNLIFDEFVNILRHIQTSPTIKYSAKVLHLISEAVKRAKRIICLDGNMADWAVNWIRQIDPTKQIVTVENISKKAKAPLTFLTGTQDEDDKLKPNDNSPFSKLMFTEGVIPVIGADSQVRCEALDNLFTAMGKTVLRIDSKTISMPHVKEFLEDCDAYLEKYKPDVTIYSPSAESGVDISIKGYFTHHILLFFGALTTDSQLQMIGRVRDISVPKLVWCRQWVSEDGSSDSKSPLANQVMTAKLKMVNEELKQLSESDKSFEEKGRLAMEIYARNNDIHTETWAILESIHNYEKANLRDCLLEQLKATGYQVEVVTLQTDTDTKRKVKEETKAVKVKTCEDIFTAEQIPIDADDEKRGKFDATWEERAKEIQASYRKRLPGIEQTDSWSPELIYKFKYGKPKFISQCETFWFFMNQEIAKEVQIDKYRRLVESESPYTSVGRFRSPYAVCKALEALGVRELIESNIELTSESPEVKEIVRKGKDKGIADAIGKYPGKDGMKYVNSILSLIGLRFKPSNCRVNNKQVWMYKIDQELASDPDRENALKCLENKWLPKTAEIATVYGVEGAALCTHSLNKPIEEVQQPEQPKYVEEIQTKSQGNLEQKSEIEELLEALPFCETPEIFAAVIDGSSLEAVENAIALTPQPKRLELQEWLKPAVAVENHSYLSKVEELTALLLYADTPEIFADVIEGEDLHDIDTAIALMPTQPIRSLLRSFREAVYGVSEYLYGNITDRLTNATQSPSMS